MRCDMIRICELRKTYKTRHETLEVLKGITLTVPDGKFVVLLGEDEVKEGVVSVKDMTTGEQVKRTPEEAARQIREKIDARNRAAVVKEKDPQA